MSSGIARANRQVLADSGTCKEERLFAVQKENHSSNPNIEDTFEAVNQLVNGYGLVTLYKGFFT